MSINSVLGTARLALNVQTAAMETASHNIANAGVAGYSRQQIKITANVPLYTAQGAIGTGVVVTDTGRVRDLMLDVNYRSQTSSAAQYGTRRDALTAVGNVFGEPSDTGLSSTLDQFWGAWGDLANAPNNSAARSVVQQRGAQVASTLNRFSSSLDGIAVNTTASLTQQTADLNRYATQVASLNRQIVAAESGGQTASDLRDVRDRAVDAMNQIVPVRVIEHSDGAASLYVANMTMVDGVDANSFSLQKTGATTSLVLNGYNISPSTVGGAIGAELGVLNTDIPSAKQQLDSLAAGIVSAVNTAHRTGWTQAGDALGGSNWNSGAPPTGSNVDFFDPTKTTAANIGLSSAVASSASYIAAGDAQNATGNNNIANKLAALRDNTSTIAKFGAAPGQTTSLGEFYRDLVTRVGVATNDADSSATVYETLAQQADTQRQSVSGVSTDDELIDMTKRQQAYAAAAKVITTATDMSQTLLDMIR